MKLTKADPSREWDLHTAAALCPADSSNKAATAEFLVGVSKRMKNPSALDDDPVEALLKGGIDPEELMKGFGGLGGLFGSGEGGREGGDKKTKSKYQFK
jgi:hypothetical protein